MEDLSLSADINSKSAVQIIRPVDHSFELQFGALENILTDNSIQDHQLAVVSIAGAFRKGKSFLMNFFLKYLYAQYKKHDISKWLGEDERNPKLEGFTWRGGQQPETIGIWMWPEIFTHKYDNGDKVAIILLDTQGIFDNESSMKDCIATFAISTLLSSVQCFNISGQVQENDLQHLDLFTKYAQLAMENNDEKPFQELLFIIRDWPYEDENPYGYCKEYVEKILMEKESQTKDMHDLRDRIRKSFEKIDAFLMAHPGMSVHKGFMKNIEPEFIECVKDLTLSLFAPDKLMVKHVNGQKWGPLDFISFLTAYIVIFNGDDLPEPKSILMATMTSELVALQMDCMKWYDESINDRFEQISERNIQPYFNDDELKKIHEDLKRDALSKFQEKRTLGSGEMAQSMKLQLESYIEEYFPSQQQRNSRMKDSFNALVKADLELIYKESLDLYVTLMNDAFSRCDSYFNDADLHTLHSRFGKESIIMFSVAAAKYSNNESAQSTKQNLIVEIDNEFERFKQLNEEKKAKHSSMNKWLTVAGLAASFGGVAAGGLLPYAIRGAAMLGPIAARGMAFLAPILFRLFRR